MYDIIILGAGTAGLTAALYANRAGMKVMIIEKGIYGGQIVNTPSIENYPALDQVSGFDFVKNLYEQAVMKFDTPVVFGEVRDFSLTGQVKTITVGENTYSAKSVILATGAEHRKLDCPGEEKLAGRGVSYCATCDGAFFRGKCVAVVGGGNTALQDAKYLSAYCEKVYLIHRRDNFRGTQIEVEQALSRSNIVPVYNSVVEEIIGDSTVSEIRLKNTLTEETSSLAVNGVFIAVGVVPQNGNFSREVAVDQDGYFIAGEDSKTNLPGVFAAGDVRTKQVRQLVTAAADGAVSAEMAHEFLN